MTTEILLAVYNGERFLAEQIDSLLQQDTSEWHLTISDDGSSDGSTGIIDKYVALYPNKIKRVFPPHRFGNARDHFFWLMKNCEADYMLFCDQDDVWHEDKVRKTLEAIVTTENQFGTAMPVLVFTDQTVVDQNLNVISPSMMKLQQMNPYVNDFRSLLIQNVVTGCTVGINRALAEISCKCLSPEHTIMHDWWIGIVAARFGKMVYLADSSMEYRQHGKNSVGAKDTRKFSYLFKKFVHPRQLKAYVEGKKTQASVFQATYADLLRKEENALLLAFSKAKTGVRTKIAFLDFVPSLPRKIFFFCCW